MLTQKEYETLLRSLLEQKRKIEIQIEFMKANLNPQRQLSFPEEKPHSEIEKKESVKSGQRFATNTTTSEAMRIVLGEAGKPLRVPEIWKRLQAEGFTLKSKNPKTSIFTMLKKNSKKFKRAKPPYWGLTEWYEKEEEKIETEVSDETF